MRIKYTINKKNTLIYKRLSFREDGLYQIARDFALIKFGSESDNDNRTQVADPTARELISTLKRYCNEPLQIQEVASFPRVLLYIETLKFISTGRLDTTLVNLIQNQELRPVKGLITG